MDGLREQAKTETSFNRQFSLNRADFSVVEIVSDTINEVSITRRNLSLKHLLDRLSCPTFSLDTGQTPKSVIRIVRIDHDTQGSLDVLKESFFEIFHACALDPYALHMLWRGSYGFVELSSDNRGVNTYYLKNNSCEIMWSHEKAQNLTRAIFIARSPNIISGPTGIFSSFMETISCQKRFASYPWFLRFVALIELSRWADDVSERARWAFRKAESQTGYGCWGYWERYGGNSVGDPCSLKTIGDLRDISQAVGFWAAAVAGIQRNIPTMADLGDIPEVKIASKKDHDEDLVQAQEAVELTLKRAVSLNIEVEYAQERARRLLSVIFSLNAQNAASTSLQIAASAKDDSESMKVVAIMTLVFLPGTFFATLFAVPMLRWTEDEVITPQFWVYWAFTAPCTVTLLALFLGRGHLLKLIKSGKKE